VFFDTLRTCPLGATTLDPITPLLRALEPARAFRRGLAQPKPAGQGWRRRKDVHKGVETLGRLPLFAELDAEDVASLDARCVWRKVKAGDLVIEECARDNDVSFVVSGHARVLRGRTDERSS
jgi:hypothetical protein